MMNYISLMQLVGCLLVIFGHLYPFTSYVPARLWDVQSFLYCFHMPLFVFCSGFLLIYSGQIQKQSFGAYAKKRAKKLLIPYVVFSLIGIVPKLLFSQFLNDSLSLTFEGITRAFLVPRENIWGHFWFLPMIYMMGLFGFAIESAGMKHRNSAILWSIVGICALAASSYRPAFGVWFGINDVLAYFWVFALGALSAKLPKINAIKIPPMGGLIIVSVALFLLQKKVEPFWAEWIKKAIAVGMIYGILFLCKSVENRVRIPKNSFLLRTYQIFILSWPCQLVTKILLERILHCPYYIMIPAEFLVGCGASILLLRLADWFEEKTGTHFLSFCLGQ